MFPTPTNLSEMSRSPTPSTSPLSATSLVSASGTVSLRISGNTLLRRLLALLVPTFWDETTVTLPKGKWVDLFSGRTFEGKIGVAELFSSVPFAVLSAAS